MKFTLCCSVAALIGTLAGVIIGQVVEVPNEATVTADHVFVWKFYGERRAWLKAYRYDGKDAKNGYDPSFTFLVSDYVPVTKKVNGKYQISFTSEIAKDLP